jgi:hypothetical protein
MLIRIPNVIGMDRTAVEAALDSLLLRYIARVTFSATGDGKAAAQDPPAGVQVPSYSIITVSYPSPMGPLDDTPVRGPTLRAGTYEGRITSVMAGNPWGSGPGAWVSFAIQIDDRPVTFTGTLYFDHHGATAAEPTDRTEWMRRGAMLGLAQRAFTNSHKVRLVTGAHWFVQSIEVFA